MVWSNVVVQQYPELTFEAVGTGNASGHVLTLEVSNASAESVSLEIGAFLVPGKNGSSQGFVIDDQYGIAVPPFGTVVVPLYGYCTDVSRFALVEGERATPFAEWVSSVESEPTPWVGWRPADTPGFTQVPPGASGEVVLTYPGTEVEFLYKINYNAYPTSASGLLVTVVQLLEAAYDEVFSTQTSSLPYLSSLDEQRTTVVQHAFWQYTSILQGHSYTWSDFNRQLVTQLEVITNEPVANFSEDTQVLLTEDANSLWAAIELVGAQAKVISKPGEGITWEAQFNRYLSETLNLLTPTGEGALALCFELADTLAVLETYLSESSQNFAKQELSRKANLAVLHQINLMDASPVLDMQGWYQLENLRRTGLYFEYLTSNVTSKLDLALERKCSQYLPAAVGQILPADPNALNEWVQVKSFLIQEHYGALIERGLYRKTDRDLQALFPTLLESRLQALPPDNLTGWTDLQGWVYTNWFQEELSPATQASLLEKFRDAFERMNLALVTQLDPKDEDFLINWQESVHFIATPTYQEFVPVATKEEVHQKLKEKFSTYLLVEGTRLNTSADGFLEEWRKLEVLVHTPWFTEYTDATTKKEVIQKLTEKFSQFLVEGIDKLDITDTSFLKKWSELERLIYTPWFDTYTTPETKEEVKRKLKEKFTAWVKKMVDDLDPKDPDFLEKWLKLERLTHSDWYDQYMAEGEKKGVEDAQQKDQQAWRNDKKGVVHPADISSGQVNLTSDQWKFFHYFATAHPGMEHKGGVGPITWVIVGTPIAAGGITTAILLTQTPSPPIAVDDFFTITCPQTATIDVLANDAGKKISVTSFTPPAMGLISQVSGGVFSVSGAGAESFSFTYTISDKADQTSTATVQVNVLLPDLQVVNDVLEGMASSGTIQGNLLANDLGVDLTVTQYTQPNNGSVTVDASGNSTFTSNAKFCGETSFTYFAEDACGQISSGVVTLRVTDDIKPVITCPENQTIECDDSTDPAQTGLATAEDNCDLNVDVTYSDQMGGSPCEGLLTRTWTAQDDAGLQDVCTQTITLLDTTEPTITCPDNLTISCGDSTDPAVTGEPEAFDNCSEPSEITFDYQDDLSSLLPDGTGPLKRTWYAIDMCGNVGTCEQIITIEDVTPPILTCPDDVQILCTEQPDPALTGTASAEDNCTLPPDMVVDYSDAYTGSGCEEQLNRTWVATDLSGNQSTCVQVITFLDEEPPTIVCPENITVPCGQEFDPTITGFATATDNCQEVTISFEDDLSGYSNCEGLIVRMFTAVDACGNASFCDQVIEVLPANCTFTPTIQTQGADCGMTNGAAGVTNISPPGPYGFAWSNGLNNPIITGLAPGVYFVTITDLANNCAEVFSVLVEEIPPVYIQTIDVDPFTCLASGDIILNLEGSGPGFFDITLSGPVTTTLTDVPPGTVQLSDFIFLENGDYTIEVTQGTACTDVETVTVDYVPPYVLQVLDIVPPSSPTSNDGEVLMQVVPGPGGLPPFAVFINGLLQGFSNTLIFNLTGFPAGVYDIYTIDQEGAGCESNIVTVELLAMPGIASGFFAEASPVTLYEEPLWATIHQDQFDQQAFAQTLGEQLIEHPPVDLRETFTYLYQPAVQGGLGYQINGNWQVYWQASVVQGTAWMDLSSVFPEGATALSTYTGLQQNLGIRHRLFSQKKGPFLGAGLRWNHLSTGSTRVERDDASFTLPDASEAHFLQGYLRGGFQMPLPKGALFDIEAEFVPEIPGLPMQSSFWLRPRIRFRMW